MAPKPKPIRTVYWDAKRNAWINPRTKQPYEDQATANAAWVATRPPGHGVDAPSQGSVANLAKAPKDTRPTIPPYQGAASKSLTVSQNTAIAQVLNAYPKWKKSGYIKTVIDAANYWKVDPVELLATLVIENASADPNIVNSVGATGLAQILDPLVNKALNPTRYAEFVRRYGQVTANFAKDPNASINYMAWRMAGTRGKYANLNDWYTHAYNTPQYKGPGPLGVIQKYAPKYVPSPVTTTEEAAAESVAQSQAKAKLTDPYVAKIVKNNKMITTGDATKALTYNGLPVARSDFLSLKNQLEDTFVTYTGKRPSNAQVQNFIRNGWSSYTLTQVLSNSKDFFKSPIYKAKAPAYQEAAKTVTAKGVVDRNLIRTAIVNNWTPDILQARLRKQPGYVRSNEFKGNVATLFNVHESIMGQPDQNGLAAISQAALAGWSVDEYAAWLRAQPEYTSSPEYQSKALSFLDQIGFLTGNTPVLKPGVAPDKNTNPNFVGKLPFDPRLASGSVDRTLNLGATFA